MALGFGPLLEVLTVSDTSHTDFFGDPLTLTHRGYWYTVNAFMGTTVNPNPLVISSALGRVVGGVFRAWAASAVSSSHDLVETKAILVLPDILTALVAAHKAKLGLV